MKVLSPGTYYRLVPKDPLKNSQFRIDLLKAASEDARIRRGLIEMCSQDCLFFINVFVWQFNPELMEKGPFITWPFQDAAVNGGNVTIGGRTRYQYGILQNVEDRKNARWPKSREMGASWLVLIVIVWLCIFKDNMNCGAMSKDEAAADKIDSPGSLFWKARFICEYLPEWLVGGRYDTKKLLIKFPRYKNVFSGEANRESSGVGDRFALYLIDEFGQFNNGEETYSMTSDTSKCRLFVFTHKDTSGMAYNLCYDPRFSEMREIITHWSMHPHKNKGLYRWNEEEYRVEYLDPDFHTGAFRYPKDFEFVMKKEPTGGPCPGIRSVWYDGECSYRTERDVLMNLDIDPRGSSELFFDVYRVNVLKNECVAPTKWTLKYDKTNGTPISLERDKNGLLNLWVEPEAANKLPMMSCGAAVDVAAGNGASPSCLSVFNAEGGRKVLDYSNAVIYPAEFAVFVVAVLRMICDENGIHPVLGWETQGGQTFGSEITDRLFYHPIGMIRSDGGAFRKYHMKGLPGFNASQANIKALMEVYRDAVYARQCVNVNAEALEDTLNFVYTLSSVVYRAAGKKRTDNSGASVHHGDLVRADALAWKMTAEEVKGGLAARRQRVREIDPCTLEYRIQMAGMGDGELVWR